MAEIFLINPGKQGKKKRIRESKKMKKNRIRRPIIKRNPSRRPSRRRRNPGKKIFGMDLIKGAKGAMMGQPGIIAGQFLANAIADQSLQDDNLEWKTIAASIAGGFGMGFVANQLKRGLGDKCLEHNLAYTLNRLVNDKLISKNDTLDKYLGQAYLAPTVTEEMAEYDMYGNPVLNGAPVTARDHLGGTIADRGALGTTDNTNSNDVIDIYKTAFQR